MHRLRVQFHLFARALGNDGVAPFVHRHHERVSPLAAIAEVGAEHPGNIAHEVDGIVPHHGLPRGGGGRALFETQALVEFGFSEDLHYAHPNSCKRSSSMP